MVRKVLKFNQLDQNSFLLSLHGIGCRHRKRRLLSPFYLLVTLVVTIVVQIKYLSKLTALTSILLPLY